MNNTGHRKACKLLQKLEPGESFTLGAYGSALNVYKIGRFVYHVHILVLYSNC